MDVWIVEAPEASHGRVHVFDDAETAERHHASLIALDWPAYVWVL